MARQRLRLRVAAADPLGGKPMPRPSEAAAKAQQGPLPTAKSTTPLYIGGVVVALVVGSFSILDGLPK